MNDSYSKSANKINYIELIRPYTKHWKWFVISALLLAILNIRYSIPEYAIQGKIQILVDQSSSSELGAFRDLQMAAGGNVQVEDEIEILNSRTNYVEVVEKLGLNTKIFATGTLK